MEEKERYELTDTDCIFDTERDIVVSDVCDVITNADIITDLLNQQDKQIKELEEENNFLEKRNEELIIDRRDICLERNDIFEENQQLKQQLHDLPKKIVEEISKELKSLYKNYPIIYSEDKDIVKSCYDKDSVNKILDAILKKYGVENE